MTDKDFENFQNTVSKTTNTKAANKLIIDVARANAKATEEYAQRMRDYIKKNEGKADFNIYQERANIWSDIQSKRKVELDAQLAALNVGEDTGSSSSSGGWSIVE
jgi:cell division septum initiation protein DivIVA